MPDANRGSLSRICPGTDGKNMALRQVQAIVGAPVTAERDIRAQARALLGDDSQWPPEPESSPATKARAGQRNRNRKTLVSLAGTMTKRGMSLEAIEAALLAENAAKCDPPLPESKVRSIAAKTRPAGKSGPERMY
jgi:hypothetical protein